MPTAWCTPTLSRRTSWWTRAAGRAWQTSTSPWTLRRGSQACARRRLASRRVSPRPSSSRRVLRRRPTSSPWARWCASSWRRARSGIVSWSSCRPSTQRAARRQHSCSSIPFSTRSPRGARMRRASAASWPASAAATAAQSAGCLRAWSVRVGAATSSAATASTGMCKLSWRRQSQCGGSMRVACSAPSTPVNVTVWTLPTLTWLLASPRPHSSATSRRAWICSSSARSRSWRRR
mmetsp:Transcript_77521/g.240129  ORF Transcript_77521/g.240129 Transcript_77521/m.240129 type:complete len:235 (-) Transcript_77521:600-1304(-)